MRDIETIRLALTAAETGHLVFSTLHTSSAPKTIDRIIDVFPAGEKSMVRSMLSESMRATITQTLLKRVGGGRVAAWEIMVATPGYPEPDQGRQGGADVLGHPDRSERRNANAGPGTRSAGLARHHQQARSSQKGCGQTDVPVGGRGMNVIDNWLKQLHDEVGSDLVRHGRCAALHQGAWQDQTHLPRT